MIYIINHHSRDISDQIAKVESWGEKLIVKTDMTNHMKTRKTKYLGLINNLYSAMTHPDEDDWRIILQDDLEYEEGVFDRVRHVLQYAPTESPVCFYNPKSKPFSEAIRKGHHVLKSYSSLWVQCLCLHKDFLAKFAPWFKNHIDTSPEAGVHADDRLLVHYLIENNLFGHGILPGLFQHEGFNRSVFGHQGKMFNSFRDSPTYHPTFDVESVDWPKHFKNAYRDARKTKFKEIV